MIMMNESKALQTRLISLSVILPTYNEADNIIQVIESIKANLPQAITAEIIVVDDNSPDQTGKIVEEYSKQLTDTSSFSIQIVHRKQKTGLSSAIIRGINSARGDLIVVMDSDFSHPPEVIPRMIEELRDPQCDIVIASRYVRGGSIIGWPFKRRIISKGATKIAQYGLGVKETKDPMSGFFALKRYVVNHIEFDAIGYKILLEILVKAKKPCIKEIPYTFRNRRLGASKLDLPVIIDYVKAVWRLYRYGWSAVERERRASVHFLSKAARFYTVGATGLLVNYAASLLFSAILLPNVWYLYASAFGILLSITSNFILNKIWTFGDRDFTPRNVIRQFGMFLGFSTFGAMIQLGMLYFLMETYHSDYALSLILAVGAASTGNFLLNKKWTFNERLWG